MVQWFLHEEQKNRLWRVCQAFFPIQKAVLWNRIQCLLRRYQGPVDKELLMFQALLQNKLLQEYRILNMKNAAFSVIFQYIFRRNPDADLFEERLHRDYGRRRDRL